MELDFVTSSLLEDEDVEFGENTSDISGIEGERCGICMDIIIDRGVLDCCQHWFCFECIDNWATITNLCPLCQSEFQLITCVPVYDTGGSNKVEDSFARDEDWCTEGRPETLSSPSYYIDENAVICLDGDSCKIRNVSTSFEGDSNLDTSIACDSCDIWYHAFCVGFDPEGASDDTWLCPRCLSNEKPHKSDVVPIESRNNQCGSENANKECVVENAFAGNFSVSVADDGETAIVVSMVKGNDWPTEPSETPLSSVQVKKNTDLDNSDVEMPTTHQVLNEAETKSSLSCDISSALPHDSKPLLVAEIRSNNADQATRDGQQLNSIESVSKSDKTITDTNLDVASITGIKRKHSDCSNDVCITAADEETKAENQNADFLKKSRVEGKVEMKFKNHKDASIPNDNSKLPELEGCHKMENVTADILSIVKGTGRRSSKIADKSSIEGDNVNGLRVKKIIRRAAANKESSVLVEKLRKEIREAVRNKSAKDIGENLFDPKLLAAFRVAVTGPKTEEPPKKLSPVALKAKKSLLQKGKVRENLTKKIYADSNGKRRRAWDRDCEVEFWKHRCIRATKPQKIETLKSVLSLLRKNPLDSGTKPSSESQLASNPILSRLYLADTSVFPRKEGIKPLSAIKETGSSEKDAKDTETNKVLPMVGDAKGTNSRVTGSKGITASDRAHSGKRLGGPSISASDDLKKDKRKWALEVLARKKSLEGNKATQEKQGDNAVLKRNYPLLAQLPGEMRPVLATSRHNKIPVSVRQAQLYRLTEYFLKKANLPIIRRTAATEFAIADAINIEKEIADKSNSKVVYLNLCSQEMLHHSDNEVLDRPTEPNSSPPPEVSVDNRLDQSTGVHSEDPTVLEALRTAGLLADSPPNSPVHKTEVPNEIDSSSEKAKEEGPDNVFEIDSNSEVDIYGDFEYDLDDEDYIGASSAKAAMIQPEEGISKVKVVFSTLNFEKSSEDPKISGNEEAPGNSPCLLRNQIDTEIQSEKTSVPLEPLLEDKPKELSLAEFEELYGPDKEPLIIRSPVEASQKLHGLVDENRIPEINNNNLQNQQVKAPDSESESNVHGEIIASNFENSSGEEKLPKKMQTGDNSQRKEKRNNTDVRKQCDGVSSVSKKVEAYIKEHIRPLCKSGVITSDQYRWAVTKTTEKVMKYHSNAKNANFLIKEGEKVKKLAEQYVESAQQKEK